MIASRSNARMKEVRRLARSGRARQESGLFLAEGRRLVEEAPREALAAVYCSESFAARPEHAELLRNLQPELVSDSVFAGISDTCSPQGILAVLRKRPYTLEEILDRDRPVLLLESIHDPGNLGTMLRTGEGAGIAGMILSRDTVDVYNPKTVRASMGSIFRVPHLVTDSLPAVAGAVRERGGRVYAAHLGGEKEYTQERYGAFCAFLIGSEATGLCSGTAALADCLIRIPMEGQVESLNAAIAAALLIYEARRQREEKVKTD